MMEAFFVPHFVAGRPVNFREAGPKKGFHRLTPELFWGGNFVCETISRLISQFVKFPAHFSQIPL